MIEFRTLGTACLSGDSGAAIRLQPKLVALLAYIGGERIGTPVRRDALLGLLWPEMDEARARNALSQALHRLRSRLPEDVLLTRGKEEIEIDGDRFRCDATAFERAASEGRPAVALRLYGGEFLKAFHLSNAAEFQHWLDDRRERYRRMALRAALVLADSAERARESAATERWLRRALEIEPTYGDALERLVRGLAHEGDLSGATRAYAGFERRLAEDYGLRPTVELADLLCEPPTTNGGGNGAGGARPPAPPADPAALRAYLRGVHFRGTLTGLEKAIACFGEAVELDPGFAAAHAGLASCLGTQAVIAEAAPERAHDRMRGAVERAMALDPELSDTHTARGLLLLFFERDWSGANAALRRALALRPDDAQAHAYLAAERAITGAHVEAAKHAERALEIAPLDPWTNFMLGWVRYWAHDSCGSVQQLTELLQLYPHFALAHLFIGENLLAQGRRDEAVAACEEGLELLPSSQLMVGVGACVIGLAGRRERAAALLARLDEIARDGYVDPLYRAAAVYGTGDLERAIDVVEAGERQPSATAFLIGNDPLYDELRAEKRFRDVGRRLGLPSHGTHS